MTLAVQYYAEAETLFGVSRGSFMPAPNVDSAVIRLTIRKNNPCAVQDERHMFRLIRAGFNQRRKTLLNSLTAAGHGKDAIAAALQQAGLSATARAEELTLADWANLSNAFQ